MSGRDMSDKEIEAMRKLVEGEGYEAMMEAVKDTRTKAYIEFYRIFLKKTGMTKHEINTVMVNKGIQNYNEVIKPDVKCITVSDVKKDISQEVNLSFVDTVSSLQDRGMMIMIKDEMGIDNAIDFLDKMGIDHDD